MVTATCVNSEKKAELIRQALETARDRINKLNDWKVNGLEKLRGSIRLNTAFVLFTKTNPGVDVETRWLWPYSRVGAEAKVESFFNQPRFATLGAIVEVSFSEIQSELDNLQLKITIDLQTFYEVYHELLAEETRTAKQL